MELGQYLLLIALIYFNQVARTKNILLVCASVTYVVYLTVYLNVTGHMVMNGFYILLIAYFVLSIVQGRQGGK